MIKKDSPFVIFWATCNYSTNKIESSGLEEYCLREGKRHLRIPSLGGRGAFENTVFERKVAFKNTFSKRERSVVQQDLKIRKDILEMLLTILFDMFPILSARNN